MKYLKFILIIALGLILVACNETPSEEVSLDDVIEEITQNLPYNIDSDLDLKKVYKYKNKFDITVNYTSDNLDSIDNDGKINRGLFDEDVIINIEASYDGKKQSKAIPFVVKAYSKAEVEEILKDQFSFGSEVTENLNFPSKINIGKDEADLTWESSDHAVISNTGEVFQTTEDKDIKITLTLSSGDHLQYIYTNLFEFSVPGVELEIFLLNVIDRVVIPAELTEDIILPTNLSGVSIHWTISNTNILTDKGKFTVPLENVPLTLDATFIYQGKILNKSYSTVAQMMPHDDRLNIVMDSIKFPDIITTNLNLKTDFDYNVTGVWTTNKPDIINTIGEVTFSDDEHLVTLTLKLTSGGKTLEKEFIVKTATLADLDLPHHHLDYATDFDSSKFNNVHLVDDRLELVAGATSGTYESAEISTLNFKTLVASWAAITSTTATAELEVRAQVDGAWSKYMTYGVYGLGLQNKSITQSDALAKLPDDIFEILNGKLADKYQYKVTLRRTSTTVDSPKLSLVSIALEIPGYSYPVDISMLPDKVEHDVPALNQNIVPIIGNSICSPTSSTMLLLYRGYDVFTDTFPHREAAELFFDHGDRIYGNWVYNTVGMSGFGANSYVKRIYSIEELFHHLATVGPVALSIRGNTGRYTTNGHLIVVTGYEITPSGRKILVNDPNLSEVKWAYTEAIYNGFTRNVIYVIE